MSKLFVKLSVTATIGGLLCVSPGFAQNTAPAAQMTQAPEVEIMHDDTAILRWKTTAPAGPSSEQFAIARCGESPDSLGPEWKSHIRVNKTHSETMWRVRIENLKPQTTYYCKVTSRDANGNNTGPESDLCQFTMPGPGERVVHYGQPQ